MIAASIYSQKDDGSLEKVLGEFSLDKNTNCGDLLEVGDKEYEVQQARCQYKYAGGQRFAIRHVSQNFTSQGSDTSSGRKLSQEAVSQGRNPVGRASTFRVETGVMYTASSIKVF